MSTRLRWAIAFGFLLFVAMVLRTLLRELPETSPWADSYLLMRRALLQLGSFGLLLVLASYLASGARKLFGWPPPIARRDVIGFCVSVVIAMLTGEALLRVYFWNGASFGDHYGPIVARYERDFVFNRYDGPARGPEIDEASSGWRVVVQGDSIAWGQGVREERDLFSSLLLEDLRSTSGPVEMAALTKPGRELDGHLEQLRRYGPKLQPDLVVYQWYSNDLEVNRTKSAPGVWRPFWRRFLLYPVLATHSYLGFFVDTMANAMLYGEEQSRVYTEYLLTDYAEGTPGWAAFESTFSEWAEAATGMAPRVLVALYPHFGSAGAPDDLLRRQTAELARRHGLEVLDLNDALTAATDNPPELLASIYDSHPGAKAHAVIAQAIAERARARWPELGRPLEPSPARAEARAR